MNNLGGYLSKKAQQLDLGRQDDLEKVQNLLDTWYPDRCHAQKIHQGKLTIITTSSSVANELRFKNNELLAVSGDITKVIIR